MTIIKDMKVHANKVLSGAEYVTPIKAIYYDGDDDFRIEFGTYWFSVSIPFCQEELHKFIEMLSQLEQEGLAAPYTDSEM